MSFKVSTLCVALLANLTLAAEFMALDRKSDTSKIRACHHDHTVSCFKAHIDFDVLQSSETLIFPEGVKMSAKSEYRSRPGFVTRYYEGETLVETATFTFPVGKYLKEGQMTGTARYNNIVYVIENCGHDCHVWYEEDMEKFKGDTENTDGLPIPRDLKKDEEESKRRLELLNIGLVNQIQAEVTVMVYYTTDVKNEYGSIANIASMVANMLANINTALDESGVPLQITLHCLEELVGFVENRVCSTCSPTILSDFANFMGSIDTLRKSADIAFLLAKDSGNPNIAGTAYIGTSSNLYPVGYVIAQYAQTTYTPAHEMAHMFGCLHNPQNNNISPPPYAYGFGNWFLPASSGHNGYRTIMAYYHSQYQNRVNRFSSPTVYFNGVPTGTASKDNARVLTETRFMMAGEGDESISCGPTVSLHSKEGDVMKIRFMLNSQVSSTTPTTTTTASAPTVSYISLKFV